MKKVLVLDFGGQYNLLVARRVRECGVYCEIRSWRESMENIRAFQPDALIFTGGPATVFEPNAPMVDPALFSMGIPVLGICYGQQLMIHLLGGQCRRAETREYGKVELTHNGKSPLFKDIPATAVYWMSHGVEVETLAPGFEVVASTAAAALPSSAPRSSFTACSSTRRYSTPSTARSCCRISYTASAASPPSGPWRPIWRRPWRSAGPRLAVAVCCWLSPAAWTALWLPPCCSVPWAIS